jgi:hypothetical protein
MKSENPRRFTPPFGHGHYVLSFVRHASDSILFPAQWLLSEAGALPGERAMRR